MAAGEALSVYVAYWRWGTFSRWSVGSMRVWLDAVESQRGGKGRAAWQRGGLSSSCLVRARRLCLLSSRGDS